jgi:predicted alpha-1,6-mannanase (GH76 family)
MRVPLIALLSLSLIAPTLAQAPAAHPNYREQTEVGIQRLQSWYVFDTGLYRTTGWWNSANVITMLANYSLATDSKAYMPFFANTFIAAQKQGSGFPGFLNKYYDDEGWWALAWIGVYDLSKDPKYLTMSESIFDDMAASWDNTCNGGIWWSKDKTYKNAIANELFLSVAAHLATRATTPAKRAAYLAWAQKEWQWFDQTGMINGQHLVNDGLQNCKNNQRKTWSYNQGVILGGLIELNRAAHNPSLITTAQAIADAALTKLTDTAGILKDGCEPRCSEDGVQFKGIFVRNLMALNDAFPNPRYRTFMDANVDAIWKNSQGPDHAFGQTWGGPFDTAKAGSQSSALDAFTAAVEMEHRTSAKPRH